MTTETEFNMALRAAMMSPVTRMSRDPSTPYDSDRLIIAASFPWWAKPFRRIGRAFCLALVNRAHERGILTSWAYHEMHALIRRAL